MARAMKNDPEGFGPNPADNPVNQFGEPIRSSDNFWKQWDSSKARRASTEGRKRTASKKTARQTALKKWLEEFRKTGNIPASPTR
jgi:protoporphyrinogen oxidase